MRGLSKISGLEFGSFRKPIDDYITVTCNNCGLPIEKTTTHLANSPNKVFYCSRQCVIEGQARQRKLSGFEKSVRLFLDTEFPGEFAYTGDGAIWLGENPRLNPDFMYRGLPIVLEAMGCLWHVCPQCFPKGVSASFDVIDDSKEKLSLYASLHYQCILVWEHELKHQDWKDRLTDKIRTAVGPRKTT